MAAAVVGSMLAGCAQKLSGTVATDGSTSMEKVIGALGEAFMEQNDGVTFTYNPTGSGSGIQAVQGLAICLPIFPSTRTRIPPGCKMRKTTLVKPV